MPGANENVTDLRGLSINVCVQTVNTSRACLLISSIAVTDIVKLTPIHYTTLHYTTLHYTTLHYTTLHHTALRCATVRCGRHDTTRHNTIQYNTIRLQSTNNISWWAAIVRLPHWRLYKMIDIVQTFWNLLCWRKFFVFWFKCHWRLFLRVKLTKS